MWSTLLVIFTVLGVLGAETRNRRPLLRESGRTLTKSNGKALGQAKFTVRRFQDVPYMSARGYWQDSLPRKATSATSLIVSLLNSFVSGIAPIPASPSPHQTDHIVGRFRCHHVFQPISMYIKHMYEYSSLPKRRPRGFGRCPKREENPRLSSTLSR